MRDLLTQARAHTDTHRPSSRLDMFGGEMDIAPEVDAAAAGEEVAAAVEGEAAVLGEDVGDGADVAAAGRA